MDADEMLLVRRFRDGDEEALRILFHRYADALRGRADRWLGRHVGRRMSAADLLQEAWLVAYQRRNDYEDRGAGSLRAWLLGIIDFKAREALRRHDAAMRATDREVSRNDRPATAAIRASDPSPSAAAMSSERLEHVRDAMAGLPEDHREVLRLGLELGLPLREVAVRMGRSHAATRKLYWRALRRLKDACAEGDSDG